MIPAHVLHLPDLTNTAQMVHAHLEWLSIHKYGRPDGKHLHLLKSLAPIMTSPLTSHLTDILKMGEIPDVCKTDTVMPI